MLCCRALDGDVVAVELLPESQWRGASAHLPQADAESTTGVDEEDGDDPEGGHIAQVWVSKTCVRVYAFTGGWLIRDKVVLMARWRRGWHQAGVLGRACLHQVVLSSSHNPDAANAIVVIAAMAVTEQWQSCQQPENSTEDETLLASWQLRIWDLQLFLILKHLF